MAQIAEGTDQQMLRFHFDALVRGLCNSSTLREHLDAELLALHHKQTCAPAALAQSLEQQPFLDKTNTVLRLVFLRTFTIRCLSSLIMHGSKKQQRRRPISLVVVVTLQYSILVSCMRRCAVLQMLIYFGS